MLKRTEEMATIIFHDKTKFILGEELCVSAVTKSIFLNPFLTAIENHHNLKTPIIHLTVAIKLKSSTHLLTATTKFFHLSCNDDHECRSCPCATWNSLDILKEGTHIQP